MDWAPPAWLAIVCYRSQQLRSLFQPRRDGGQHSWQRLTDIRFDDERRADEGNQQRAARGGKPEDAAVDVARHGGHGEQHGGNVKPVHRVRSYYSFMPLILTHMPPLHWMAAGAGIAAITLCLLF